MGHNNKWNGSRFLNLPIFMKIERNICKKRTVILEYIVWICVEYDFLFAALVDKVDNANRPVPLNFLIEMFLESHLCLSLPYKMCYNLKRFLQLHIKKQIKFDVGSLLKWNKFSQK